MARESDGRAGRSVEGTRERARRYLREGRLGISAMNEWEIRAICHGHSRIYRLGFDMRRAWWCECGRPPVCPHLAALLLVADVPGAAGG